MSYAPYRPQRRYFTQPQYVNVSALVDKYAMPYLLNFLEGKTETQYHQLMRTNPDFVSDFRRRDRLTWTIAVGAMRAFGRINLSPDYEAQKLVALIKRRGWKVYRSEYDCFRANIARFLAFVNS